MQWPEEEKQGHHCNVSPQEGSKNKTCTKKKKTQKTPQHHKTNLKPSTITLNIYQILRCLFPLFLLLSQCPIWIYGRTKVFHFHMLCCLSFSPGLNGLEKISCWDNRCWVRKELNRETAAVSLWTVCIWDRAGQMSFYFYINTGLCTLQLLYHNFGENNGKCQGERFIVGLWLRLWLCL